MSDTTAIEWTDATFNPWWGCVKISPACDHCYAEAFSHRLGRDHWGAHATYRTFPDKHWDEPLRWDRKAAKGDRRMRVFCASMADVFDNAADPALRARLWALIRATPNIDWQLLTKRPQNIASMLPLDWGNGYANVWLGTTAENQEEADRRIPKLLDVPAAVRFLSYEPALGPVDFGPYLSRTKLFSMLPGFRDPLPGLDWIIAGGESGPKARPPHPDWFRHARNQCAAARLPFLFKQWGEWAPDECQGPNVWQHLERPRARWNGSGFDIERPGGWPDDENLLFRLGKKTAGRELDGRTHDEFPRGAG